MGLKLYPQRTSLCDHECTFCILFVCFIAKSYERKIKKKRKKLKDKTKRGEEREGGRKRGR